MSFTVLILSIAIINLVVGFASASYLGWGPRSWNEIDLALSDPQTVSTPVEAPCPYRSDLDLQRLIDDGQRKLRKLSSTKTVLEDPLQTAYIKATNQLDSLEIGFECIHASLLADELTETPRDWPRNLDAIKTDLGRDIDKAMGELEHWADLLNGSQQETFNPFHFGLCNELSRIQNALPSISSREQLNATDRSELTEWCQSSYEDLRRITWQVRSLMRDLITESRPALEWEPQLLRDRSHQMQSIEAFAADRILNPTGSSNYFVARCRIDQALELYPKTSHLLFRIASERLLEQANPYLPSHWLAVPLPQGEWLIRGDADSLDNFVAQVDEVRQRLRAINLRVGESTFQLTSSWIITLDSPSFATEDLLVALKQAVHEARSYGQDRTFICEKGHPVPVLAVECDPVPDTINL